MKGSGVRIPASACSLCRVSRPTGEACGPRRVRNGYIEPSDRLPGAAHLLFGRHRPRALQLRRSRAGTCPDSWAACARPGGPPRRSCAPRRGAVTEAVPEVVGPRSLRSAERGGAPGAPLRPVPPVVAVPWPAVVGREYQRAARRPSTSEAPFTQIRARRGEEPHGARPPGLGLLDLAERGGPRDQDGSLASVIPRSEREGFSGLQSRVGKRRYVGLVLHRPLADSGAVRATA